MSSLMRPLALCSVIVVVLLYLSSQAHAYTLNVCRLTEQDKDPHDWQLLLPIGYSATQTPGSLKPASEARPDEVYNSMEILDIDDVNEAEMFFLVSIWADERLNVSSIMNLPRGRLLLPDDAFPCFWAPSIVFDNDREETLFKLTFLNSMMIVYKNHTVVRASRFSLKIRCSTDLTLYPVDTQNCHFRMRLIDESDALVTMRWLDHKMNNSENLTVYAGMAPQALKYNEDINLIKYRLGPLRKSQKSRMWLNDRYTYLCIHFPFIRRLTSSVVTIFIPSSLTVITSWVSFWMDVDAVPARTTLGLMSILTIITQILDVRKILPAINYVTAIDYWLFVCLVFVFLAFIEFAFAYTIVRKQKLLKEAKANEVEPWASPVSVDRLKSPITLAGQDHKEELLDDRRPSVIDLFHLDFVHRITKTVNSLATFTGLKHDHKAGPNESDLDNLSKSSFPFAFVLFASIYWTYYLAFKGDVKWSECDFT